MPEMDGAGAGEACVLIYFKWVRDKSRARFAKGFREQRRVARARELGNPRHFGARIQSFLLNTTERLRIVRLLADSIVNIKNV